MMVDRGDTVRLVRNFDEEETWTPRVGEVGKVADHVRDEWERWYSVIFDGHPGKYWLMTEDYFERV